MNPNDCLQKQIDRGIGVLHRLNDLEEDVVGKCNFNIKLFEGQKFYDESQLEILETIVKNWQEESMTCLGLLGYDKEGFIPPFQSNRILTFIDKRKDLFSDVEYGLRFLRSLKYEVEAEMELPHFPIHSTKEKGLRLFDNLNNNIYMEADLDCWLFFMGFVNQKPQNVKPIIWKSTKEQLRVMLRLLLKELIDKKIIKVAELEKLTPKIFVNINNKPLKLAKPKEEISKTMDKLIKIFRPTPTSSETL